MCYVGRHGGQGAHAGMRCEGGALGLQRPPVDPVGGDDDVCLTMLGSNLLLFYCYLLIFFSFTSSLSFLSPAFCLSPLFCSTDTLTSMGDSNNCGRLTV